MRTVSRLIQERGPKFRESYHVDFRTEAARDFTADASDYTDSRGGVATVENVGAAAVMEIGEEGLVITPSGATNVTGSTRTAPLLRWPVSTYGVANEYTVMHSAIEFTLTTGGTNTGAIILWEGSAGNNNSRNYIGDVSGTARASSQVTIGGSATTVGTYDPPSGHPGIIRVEQLTGFGGDWDWYGDGEAVLGPPSPGATLRGERALQPLTTRPFGWDRGAVFAPASTGRFLVSVAGAATVKVRQIWVQVMNLADLP